jgi:hypothetical protein
LLLLHVLRWIGGEPEDRFGNRSFWRIKPFKKSRHLTLPIAMRASTRRRLIQRKTKKPGKQTTPFSRHSNPSNKKNAAEPLAARAEGAFRISLVIVPSPAA